MAGKRKVTRLTNGQVTHLHGVIRQLKDQVQRDKMDVTQLHQLLVKEFPSVNLTVHHVRNAARREEVLFYNSRSCRHKASSDDEVAALTNRVARLEELVAAMQTRESTTGKL